MPVDLATIGMAAGTAAANYGLQAASQARGYNKSRRINEQLEQIQMRQTDYNIEKQKELWEYTGPVGQKEQLKKAGLNPALMYGMSGAGGGTTSIATGSAPSGNVGGGDMGKAFDIGEMAQLQLLEAQRKNIEADTKLKDTEANKKAGVDTELGNTQIKSLTQGIENQKAVEALTKAETNLTNIRNAFEGETFEDRAMEIEYNAQKAKQIVRSATATANIDEATQENKIKIVEEEAIGATLRNNLTRAETELTKEQVNVAKSQIEKNNNEINKWAQELQQGWTKLEQSEKIMKVEAIMKEMSAYTSGLPIGSIRTHDAHTVASQIDKIMGIRREDYKKPK